MLTNFKIICYTVNKFGDKQINTKGIIMLNKNLLPLAPAAAPAMGKVHCVLKIN